jgi:TonB family protein
MHVTSLLRSCLLFVLFCGCAAAPMRAQTEASPAQRKVVAKVTPAYPALARTMNLTGMVKLEALVQPNGTVKAVQIKGGNPVLAQAAESAVRGWKWEKSDHDTTETLEIHFTP